MESSYIEGENYGIYGYLPTAVAQPTELLGSIGSLLVLGLVCVGAYVVYKKLV